MTVFHVFHRAHQLQAGRAEWALLELDQFERNA